MHLKKELPVLIIIALPFLYLSFIWKELPERVPMHWNINGEIDRYGDKTELWLIPILLPLLTYVMLLVIPKIDPKNKLNKTGNKLPKFRFILTTFMSILALFIIYSAKNTSFSSSKYITILVGFLFVLLGNYFKTIPANYFIGIRTPWTLENETVWRETHKLGGKLWFLGGILIIISTLIFPPKINGIVMSVVIGILVVVPVAFSYVKFKKLSKI
ncbi:MAG TPA: DUF1648 domain-containing protein [Flavobacteriia bacterium]|nr:DUF1648 domain-containing protein [Flavobacteriia bacterium]